MKQNNWAHSTVPIDVYRVSSKGIRHIRTIIPGGKPKDDRKRHKGDDKRKKPD